MSDSSDSIFHHAINVDKHKAVNNAADLLSSETGISKQKIKQAMQQGAVWLQRNKKIKRIRKGNTSLAANDKLDIYYNPALLKAPVITPVLIHDEGAYSVWYKPRGLLSQGSLWGDAHAINRYAELHLVPQRPVFLIHRLDREACGLMLLAHNKSMAAQLSKLFQERKVSKHYRALVNGDFDKQSVTLDKKLDGKAALTSVQALHYDVENNRSLLSIQIETGRKHQIRRHLADVGFPVMGDSLYGDSHKSSANPNLQLLSLSLAFACPVKKHLQNFSLLAINTQNFPDELESLLFTPHAN